MKYNDPYYWDWEDAIFKDYVPQNMSRKLENLAKEYDVPPVKKIEEFPLGEIFFTKTGRSSSATEMKVTKPRSGKLTVDLETYPFFTGTDHVARAISDDFYDTMAMCFGLTTKSSDEKPVLNDRPYRKGYPE